MSKTDAIKQPEMLTSAGVLIEEYQRRLFAKDVELTQLGAKVRAAELDAKQANHAFGALLAESERLKAECKDAKAFHAETMAERNRLLTSTERLIAIVKMAYRKHVMNDESIGWMELDNRLCDELCNAIGDEAFQLWLEEMEGNQP